MLWGEGGRNAAQAREARTLQKGSIRNDEALEASPQAFPCD